MPLLREQSLGSGRRSASRPKEAPIDGVLSSTLQPWNGANVDRVTDNSERPQVTARNRGLTRGMRALLQAATVLVLLAGVQLFVFSERTAEWFAWTVNPPLTAAFLGAAYWASAAVEWTSSRAASWADARIAVPSVFTFTSLTFFVTVLHIDKFHLDSEFSAVTQGVTWAWIAIYALVPVLMALLWRSQARIPGGEPPRRCPLPRGLIGLVAVVAAALLGLGAWMLVDPLTAARWWPWELTPLTGRAVGAWLVGLGVSAAQTAVEGDGQRARPVAVGAVVLPVLATVALLRYSSSVAWGSLASIALLASLAVWSAIGVVLLGVERRGGRLQS